MPNTFAHIVLLSWPLVGIFLFRRFSLPTALVWTILGGYLFLPSRPSFDYPFIPAIDKNLIPSLTAAVLCMVTIRQTQARGGVRGADRVKSSARLRRDQETTKPPASGRSRPTVTWIIRILIGAYIIAPLLTAMTNPDPIVIGGRVLPGLDLRDALSATLRSLVAILPFLLARRYLADAVAQVNILRGFCIAGLLYSLLVLFEVRMSPQLNVNLFGYFSHSFAQHLRGGGWRPIIFLQHGLWVGIFLSMSILSAMTLFKHSSGKPRLMYLLVILWMVPILVISKNFGALIITFSLAPFLLLGSIRMKILLAATVVVIVLSFPALRGANLVPVGKLLTTVQSINAARAASLSIRLKNEDLLLAKANQKPFFGWGGWDRSRVFDAFTGRDISITDGIWVIIIGLSGWFGYLATFGLICIPTFLLAWRRRSQLTVVTAGLALVLCANLVDLIPNATLTPLTWLVAGAIAGYCQRVWDPASEAEEQKMPTPAAPRFARSVRPPHRAGTI